MTPTEGSCTSEYDEVALTFDLNDLPAGDYTCSLTVSDPCASNSPFSESVRLRLNDGICFPDTAEYAQQHTAFLEYMANGIYPACWCWPYQCDGDGDNARQGCGYRIYTNDLNMLNPCWKKRIGDPELNPCADYDHKAQGMLKYRVYTGDLQKLIDNWRKKNSNLPANCPRPDSER